MAATAAVSSTINVSAEIAKFSCSDDTGCLLVFLVYGVALTPEHLARCVPAGCTHHAAARMRCCAAEIEATQRHAITCEAGHRAEHEELMQAHRALEYVAAGKIECLLEVDWAQDLTTRDRTREAGCVLFDEGEAAIREGVFTRLVPWPVRE